MAFVVIVVAGVGVGVGVGMVVVVVLVAVVVMPMAVPKAMVLVTIFVVFEIMTYQQYWTYSYTGKLSCANGGRHKTGKKEHVCQNKYVDIFENICTTNAITGLHHFGCCCLLKALHKQYGSTICYTTTWAASFFRV